MYRACLRTFMLTLVLLGLSLAAASCATVAPGPSLADLRQERREKYVAQHPDLPDKVRAAILGGKIVLGMTRDDVVASWGKPHDVNRTVTAYGVSEQWVYGRTQRYGRGVYGFIPNYYLYFEDGVLESWQES